MAEESLVSKAEVKTPSDKVRRWLAEIANQLKTENRWRSESKKTVERYREEDARSEDDDSASGMNILASNINTARAALYQQPPRPDIRRRYMDRDPVARSASEILERTLSYCVDDYDFDAEMKAAVIDYQLPGRGAIRVRFNTYGEEAVERQSAPAEYVFWEDLVIGPARCWSDVPWLAFRHRMTRDEVKRRYGEAVAKEMEYTHSLKADDDDPESIFKRAEVWEIWDKDARNVLWIAKGIEKPLKEEGDRLGLEDFFPMPRPLFANMTNDSLIPVPEYKQYRKLALELDDITERISKLTDMLKVRGVYASSEEEIASLLEAEDGQMIPMQNPTALYEKGGLEGAFMFQPLDQIIKALQQLYQARNEVKQTIYEVSGFGDLLRGASDPNETATAQRIKGQFGSLRLDEKKREVARFARDVLRIKAEIICKHFDPGYLLAIANTQQTPETDAAIALLKNAQLRGFRVDIETESTIAPDESAEQEATAKAMEVLGSTMERAAMAVQSGVLTQEIGLQLVRMALAPFRNSRKIEQMLDDMEAQAQEQEGQPEQPDPAQQAAQADAQAKMVEAQTKMQAAQMSAQNEQIKSQVEQQKHQMAMMEHAAEHENKMLELQITRQELEQRRVELSAPVADGGASSVSPPQGLPQN